MLPTHTQLMRALLQLQIAILSLFSCLSYAEVSISGLENIRISAWAGTSGDLRGSDSYCALSYTQQCTGPWWNRRCTRTAQDYDVAAYTDGASDGAGNFYLQHSTSSSLLPVRFEWINPQLGAFAMTNYLVTGETAPPTSPYAPGATGCSDLNAQNTIAIIVNAADIGSAPAGMYSETFRIDMCRLNGGGNSSGDCVYPVAFSVELPDLIQITRLDDVAFGVWSGAGELQRVEQFCVFRNGASSFSLVATGSSDQNNSFHLQNGGSLLPYEIEVGDGTAWIPMTPGNLLSSGDTSFVGSSRRDCGGEDSHSLRMSILEADLRAASSGDYRDTVTVVVEPE